MNTQLKYRPNIRKTYYDLEEPVPLIRSIRTPSWRHRHAGAITVAALGAWALFSLYALYQIHVLLCP
jgi:hypothetical protein